MFNIIKDIWKILRGEKLLICVDAEDMIPTKIKDLNDLDLINHYQNHSIKSNEFIQEFLSRNVSDTLKVLPRDFDEELSAFDKDLQSFIETSVNKENFDRADKLKGYRNIINALRNDIKNNRQYIQRVK